MELHSRFLKKSYITKGQRKRADGYLNVMERLNILSNSALFPKVFEIETIKDNYLTMSVTPVHKFIPKQYGILLSRCLILLYYFIRKHKEPSLNDESVDEAIEKSILIWTPEESETVDTIEEDSSTKYMSSIIKTEYKTVNPFDEDDFYLHNVAFINEWFDEQGELSKSVEKMLIELNVIRWTFVTDASRDFIVEVYGNMQYEDFLPLINQLSTDFISLINYTQEDGQASFDVGKSSD